MRFNRLIAPAVLALTFAGCTKKDSPTGPGANAQRLAAAEALTGLSTRISDPAAKSAADQAAAALNLGAPITTITLTTGTASVVRNAVVNARVAADIGGGAEDWQATALQVVISNSSTSAANGTFNVLAMWKGGSDLVFVGMPNSVSSGSIGTTGAGAFGGLFSTPDKAWQATGGTASLTGSASGGSCANFASITGVTCENASFTGGFSITSSAPYTGGGTNGATGSKTAALTSRSIAGFKVTINCSTFAC